MNKLFGLLLSLAIAIAPVNTGLATLVSTPSPIFFPSVASAMSGSPTLSPAFTITSANTYLAYVFQAKENMTISHVSFFSGTATATPVMDVRVETVDSAGLPTGTLWATNTNGSTGTISSSTTVLTALTASASITKGQFFAIKIAYTSGTSVQVQQINLGNPGGTSLPYGVTNTGGTPAKVQIGGQSTIALGSSSTTFYELPGSLPITATTATSNFNNTNSAKRGIKFSLPFNCRIAGVRFFSTTSVGDYNAGIYDAAGAGVGSTVTAFTGAQNAANANGTTIVLFSTPLTYTANTTLYAAVEPTTATNVSLGFLTIPANYQSAMPGGINIVYSAFATSSWTDTATQYPLMDLIIDQVDNGAGGGSSGGRIIGG